MIIIIFLADVCALSVFGWLDVNAQQWNEDVIKEDLKTLPPQVTADISEESIRECVMAQLEEYTNHP